MDHRPATLLLAAALTLATPFLAGQEGANPGAVSERLRNALRNVTPESGPAAAEEPARKDPEEAVREATRIFQNAAEGIDAEKLKESAAKIDDGGLLDKAKGAADQMKSEGLLDEVAGKAGPAMEQMKADGSLDEAAAKAEAVLRSAAEGVPSAAGGEAAARERAEEAPVIVPSDVPATRPPPGVAGGVPTPVAMPLDPGESAPAVEPAPPAAAGALPSAVAVATGTATVVETGRARALPDAPPTTPSIPELPVLDLDEVPAPMPLERKYGHAGSRGGRVRAEERTHMEIRSKESVMDNAKGILTFTGDVFIDAPEYEMRCEKLVIYLADGVGMEGSGESDSSFKRAVATGGMVEIKRFAVDEKGNEKVQIALGRIADYNAVTNEFVLTGGPPYIQDGDKFVKTESEDAKVIMRGNGIYEIIGSTGRQHISIPVENDGKKKGPNMMPSGLEGTMNRRR